MNLGELIERALSEHTSAVGVILLAMTLIQVSPLKLDPWSLLATWIGKAVNKPVIDKIESVDSSISDIDQKVDSLEEQLRNHVQESTRQEIQNLRYYILSFGSAMMGGTNYNKERFDFVISECDRYQKLCKDNDVTNGVADATIAEIRRVYGVRLKDNSFLKEGGYGDV